MPSPTDGTVFLDAEQVRERYGNRSRMWLWRRESDPAFPKSMKIGTRNFWRLADLLEYEEKQSHAT